MPVNRVFSLILDRREAKRAMDLVYGLYLSGALSKVWEVDFARDIPTWPPGRLTVERAAKLLEILQERRKRTEGNGMSAWEALQALARCDLQEWERKTLSRMIENWKGYLQLDEYNQVSEMLKDHGIDFPPVITVDYRIGRDELAERSGTREADHRLSVASALLSCAVQNGQVETNHLKGFKRLYHSNRSDVIWQAADIEAFMAGAPLEMQRALILALHTGLRQGDILKLSWNNYDGQCLRLRIGKNQRGGIQAPTVAIPCTRTLREMLDGLDRRSAVILCTSTGRPYLARHFGKQWSLAMKAAGLGDSPLHFHDLRGTAVTMLAEAGCSIPQIVSITQHSLATATRILEVYLSRTQHLANQAIAQFENASATNFANRLQTAAPQRVAISTSKG